MLYFIQVVTLFFSVFLGAILFIYFKKIDHKFFSYTLAYSGSFLFSVAILHILPDVYREYTSFKGVAIIIGFFLQIILELFTGGIEHGHLNQIKKKHELSFFIPLCLHSILDSLILYNAEHVLTKKNLLILTSIILHKIPASFVLASILFSISANKFKNYTYLFIFAIISPIGVFLNNIFLNNFSTFFLETLKAVAAGSFLSIAITIFFESNEPNHLVNKKKLLIILIGLFSGLFIEFIHFH